jgi:hypothetical protein
LGDAPRNEFGCLETVLINVMQADFRIGKLRKGEDIPNQVLGENGASSSDECDFSWCTTHELCS